MAGFSKDLQYYKFCAYGFLKNLRFFEPFLILFFLEKDINYLQIGLLYTIREITRNLFEIPAGVAADVLGRRRSMIISFSLYIISFLLYSVSRSMSILSAATIVFGLGEAFRTGTHKAMIFDYLQHKGWSDHKVHYYGHTRSWSQAGSAISALLAAGLVFYSGKYMSIFLYTIIPYLFGLILIISYPAWLDGRTSTLKSADIWRTSRQTLMDFLHSIQQGGIFQGTLSISSYGGYVRAVRDYLQPIIQAFALSLPVLYSLESARKSAILIGVIYFFIYLLSMYISRLSAAFTKRIRGIVPALNITLAAGFAAGAISGLFYTFDLILISIVFFVLVYQVENLRLPAGISWFADNVNTDVLATALSVESQGKSIITAILALGMGLLADHFGPGSALLVISVLMLVLFPFLKIGKSR